MEDKDLKYNEILDMLKKTEPVLNNPEGLTDRIMQRVEQTAADVGKIRVMRIAGALSGVAASALICLLAYETLMYPVSPVENYPKRERSYELTVLQDIRDKEKIIETVLKKREAQRKRKEQLSAYIAANHRITIISKQSLKF
jgi:hypothetical protein